jgi:long-chain acyl-CoA synthetase
MLQTIVKSRPSQIVFIRITIPFVQTRTFTYKTRIRRLYNDGIDLKQQSVEIDPTERIRRCSFYKDVDLYSFYKTTCPNVRTLGDALNDGYIASKDGPCIGTFQSSNDATSLQWLSYSKVIEQSRAIGSYFWTKTKLIPMKSKVAILSSNRPEYLFVEQACYKYGFIVISLYTTYDSDTILNVLQRTQADVLVVDNFERIQSIEKELLDNNQIKEIIVFDEIIDNKYSKIRPISTIFNSMKNTDICKRPIIDPESIATFILTSGTTGRIIPRNKSH